MFSFKVAQGPLNDWSRLAWLTVIGSATLLLGMLAAVGHDVAAHIGRRAAQGVGPRPRGPGPKFEWTVRRPRMAWASRAHAQVPCTASSPAWRKTRFESWYENRYLA